MNPSLDEIFSIINGDTFAKDRDRVFTYIEFVKMFGFDNDPNIFINYYKEYVTRWAEIKHQEINVSDEEFVFSKLVEILKSITLDYSSYEEQDFISHINLNNKAHLKALSSLYSRKIREITEFYRKKRNESSLVVNRNSLKGSTKSIQEIIYEKVFDFIFSNKNIVPSYKNIKRDLLVTVEQYVDTYSEYFDIPRTYEFTDETRREMLTANINQVDYRVYLEIELVVSEILFSGNVMLEEIPLIAQLGIDLSQSCVGDMLALKNSLMANTTINQVDLNEQVALKRKLYEKYLGCDLWYLYVDLQGNVTMDVLCKAKNPTGNLLNCGSPDTATIPSGQEELLSHIGLFFKPDKTSILKINAKDYTWSIDTDNLIEDTVYIFPDPNSYGDIGNNKDNNYPLIMEYRTNYDIRNLSSGTSTDDPLMFITDQGWRSYYSKQDDDFKNIKNVDWEYSFTYLSNKGFLSQYQKDIWGNEWGLLKGCEISTGKKTVIENGKEVEKEVPKLTLIGNGFVNEMIYGTNQDTYSNPKIINGGYFEHPLYRGKEKLYVNPKTKEEEIIWVYQDSVSKVVPFNYDLRLILNKNYIWSGIEVHGYSQDKKTPEFSPSMYDTNYINFGNFGDSSEIIYEDHFQVVPNNYADIIDDERVIINVLQQFLSVNLLENPQFDDMIFETKDATHEELKAMDGELYIKLVGDLKARPLKFRDVFSWIPNVENLKIYSFMVYNDNLIIDTKDEILFIPYQYDGKSISNNLGTRVLLKLKKVKSSVSLPTKSLFVEDSRKFYILQLKEWKNYEAGRVFALPYIYEFDPVNYELKEIINPFDGVYKDTYEKNYLARIRDFEQRMAKKETLIGTGSLLKNALNQGTWLNFLDFEIPTYDDNGYGELGFTFNSALGTYLLSYVLIDNNGTPYIYEHKFKITSLEDFESSLKTNVYTLKSLSYDEDGQMLSPYYVSTQNMTGGTSKSYPFMDSSYKIFKSGTVLNQFEVLVDAVQTAEIMPISFDDEVSNINVVYDENNDLKGGDLKELVNGSEFFKFAQITSFSLPVPNLTKATEMFKGCKNLLSFNSNLPRLKYGIKMFENDSNLQTFEVDDLSTLVIGSFMFRNTGLSNFAYDMSNLIDGQGMFEGCKNLQSISSDLTVLINGDRMFCNSKVDSFEIDTANLVFGNEMFKNTGLKEFKGNLKSLKSGQEMFKGCNLDQESIKLIAESIKDLTNNTDWTYIIDGVSFEIDENQRGQLYIQTGNYDIIEVHEHLNKIIDKGWVLNVNGIIYEYISTELFVIYDERGIVKEANTRFLVNGYKLFENNGLYTFEGDLSSLEDGTDMFKGCKNLSICKVTLPKLKNGQGMFEGCNLNYKSTLEILSSLCTNEGGKLTLGVENGVMKKISQIIGNPISYNTWIYKGWEISIINN